MKSVTNKNSTRAPHPRKEFGVRPFYPMLNRSVRKMITTTESKSAEVSENAVFCDVYYAVCC